MSRNLKIFFTPPFQIEYLFMAKDKLSMMYVEEVHTNISVGAAIPPITVRKKCTFTVRTCVNI